MPNLTDPSFSRSVVLLCTHTKDGAFGLVINRTLTLSMADICREAEIPWQGNDQQTAWYGGPVEPQRGWLLHSDLQRFEGSQTIEDSVAVTSSQDALLAYATDPTGTYKLVVGCAGWGAGQLEEEIKQGAWLTAPFAAKLLFDIEAEAIWPMAVASIGVDPAALVQAGSQLN